VETPSRHSRLKPEQRVMLLFNLFKFKRMGNYKKTKELIERKEESVSKLIKFFKEEENYQSIMTQMAMAQTSIMELIDLAMARGYERHMPEITTFFSTIQCLMFQLEDLSDLAKEENNG
jgi:5-methylcytosine-specific restriction endonuclease McrBC regulatory subunit McrC